jgi:hypothetical protein
MDRDISRQVIRATLRSSGELTALLPVLKAHCAPDEYQVFSRAIAAVVAECGQQLLNRVFAEHPELEAEVDAAIAMTGRY